MRAIIAVLLLSGCAAKPTVCGKIVAMRSYTNDWGPGAFIAIADSSGTVHQARMGGIYALGMTVCFAEGK